MLYNHNQKTSFDVGVHRAILTAYSHKILEQTMRGSMVDTMFLTFTDPTNHSIEIRQKVWLLSNQNHLLMQAIDAANISPDKVENYKVSQLLNQEVEIEVTANGEYRNVTAVRALSMSTTTSQQPSISQTSRGGRSARRRNSNQSPVAKQLTQDSEAEVSYDTADNYYAENKPRFPKRQRRKEAPTSTLAIDENEVEEDDIDLDDLDLEIDEKDLFPDLDE